MKKFLNNFDEFIYKISKYAIFVFITLVNLFFICVLIFLIEIACNGVFFVAFIFILASLIVMILTNYYMILSAKDILDKDDWY